MYIKKYRNPRNRKAIDIIERLRPGDRKRRADWVRAAIHTYVYTINLQI